MKKTPLIVALLAVVATSSSGCAIDRSNAKTEAPKGSNPRVASVHGLQAPHTDEALTQKAPIVLIGAVTSRADVAIKDDPYLPAGWDTDPTKSAMVNGGGLHRKWQVSVITPLKGSTASTIHIARLLTAGKEAHVESIKDIGSLTGGVDPQPGNSYRFWLEPYEWFGQEHYVLVRAKAA